MQTRRLPIQTLVAILCLFVAIALIGMGLAYALAARGDQTALVITLVVAATVALACPVLTALRIKPYDILHPLNFVALSLFFGVFARTLYLVSSRSPKAVEVLEGYPLAAVLPGAILSAIGSLCICIGFSLAGKLHSPARFLNRFFASFNSSRLMVILPIIFIVCAFVTVLFLRATGFQYSGISSLSMKRRVLIEDVESSLGYYRLIAQDVPRAILLLLTAVFLSGDRRTNGVKFAWVAFLVLAIALPFLASSRASVLIAIISVSVVYNKLRPIPLGQLGIAAAICVVIIFGMLGLRRTGTRGANFDDSVMAMGVEPLLANHSFADVIKLGHIYRSVPELIDYKKGSSFLTVFYAPIPRSLWPAKPKVSMGREITEQIYNRGLDLAEKGGGTPPGLFGETWINFGIYGFVPTTLAFGVLLCWLTNTLSMMSDQSDPGAALYGGVLPAFCLSIMGGDFTRGLVQGLSMMGILVGLVLLSRIKWLPSR